MKNLSAYALLAILTAAAVSGAYAGPSGKEEFTDNVPEERYERYEREERYPREEIYEREIRYGYRDQCDHPALYSGRSRTVYIIVDDRPVRRVIYMAPRGGYYRIVDGRRVAVRERYFTSYPSRYFYPDGRRRLAIRLP